MPVYPALKPRKEITTQRGLPKLPGQKVIFILKHVKNIVNRAVIFPSLYLVLGK